MKKAFSSILIFLGLIFYSQALCYNEVNVLDKVPTEYEKITVTTGAVSRLNQVYREAAGAVFITVEGNNIRYRIDGEDPDATNGHLVVAGVYQNLWLFAEASVRSLRMIAIGGDATVIVTYYRRI